MDYKWNMHVIKYIITWIISGLVIILKTILEYKWIKDGSHMEYICNIYIYIYMYMVGGKATPPKNMSLSVGMMNFPVNVQKNMNMFQSTKDSTLDIRKVNPC